MDDDSGAADLLTAAEECRLAYQIEAGALAWQERQATVRRSGATEEELLALEQAGRQARQRFVRANLGLVNSLVRGCAARTGLPRDELFQEGCLGLLIAVARFDHRRGIRFSTYAVPWIRARLGEAVQRRGSGPSVRAAGAGRLREARAAEDLLVQTLGRAATTAEVAARAGLDHRGYRRLLAWQRIGSLDDAEEPVRLPDSASLPDEVADRSEWTAEQLLWHLTPIEQAVLRQRYGLPAQRPATPESTDQPTTTNDAATSDPATGDRATGDPTTGDPATGDRATGDRATGDPTTGDPATGDRATGDPVPDLADGAGGRTSFAAIGRRLGMSASSVRRIEARALRRLREVCAAGAGRMTA